MSSIFKRIKERYNIIGLKLVKDLQKLLERKSILINKKIYLTRCLKSNLIPKTLLPKVNESFSRNKDKIIQKCGLLLVKDAIKDIKLNIGYILSEINSIYIKMRQIMGEVDVNSVKESLDVIIEKFDSTQKENHIKKYNNLRKPLTTETKEKPKFVTNLSNRTLNENEEKILSFGSKFEITPKDIPFNDIITSMERNLTNFDEKYKQIIRKKVANILWKAKVPN